MTEAASPDSMEHVRRVARSTLIVIGGAGITFGISLLRQRIVAQLFGTLPVFDAYTAADSVSELLVNSFGVLTFAYAFTPVYIEFLQKNDREKANYLVSQVANTLFILAGVAAAIAALFARTLVSAPWGLGPGFAPDVQATTVAILRILMLSTVLFTVSGLVTGVLQAHNHFWLPALSPTVYGLGIIFGALVICPRMPANLQIYGLAWGAVIGAALHLLIQVPGLFMFKVRWRPVLNLTDPALQHVLFLTAPRILDLMMARASITWLNSNLSSHLGEGRVSSLAIAYRVMNIPWTIIGTALGLAIFPLMAELAARKDVDAQRQAVSGGLRAVLIFTIPAAAGLLVIGKPLIRLLFEGGAFNEQSTELVYFALQFYTLALISQSMLDIVVRAFAAQQDTWTPLFVSFFTTAINVALAIWLARPFAQGGIEHGGPALANGVAVLIEASIGLTILHMRWKGVDARRILVYTVKALIAAGAMIGALSLIQPLLGQSTIIIVAVSSVLGIAIYLGVAYLLGIREVVNIPLMIVARFIGSRRNAQSAVE